MPTFSRRTLILGSASAAVLALAFPPFAGGGESIDVEAFRALSSKLTGASLTDLDMGAAAKLLAGFISMRRLTASPPSALQARFSGTRSISPSRQAFVVASPAIGQMRLGPECIANG